MNVIKFLGLSGYYSSSAREINMEVEISQLPLPIIVYFFLLLCSLQVLGEGKTWLGHNNFPISKKA
jgi:hypothetical protein